MKNNLSHQKLNEYFEMLDETSYLILKRIRDLIKETFPNANETLSYGVPAFKDDKVFFYYAAFKKHIGIYPPIQDSDLKEQLKRHMNDKGNLYFYKNEEIPYEMIRKIAIHLYDIYHT